MAANDDLKAMIRTIPDFPTPGIQFRDLTPLLRDPRGFAVAVDRLGAAVLNKPDLVAGIEARGFVIAAALALRMGAGVLMIRKDGKLPGETITEDYALEYGSDRLAIQVDACAPGANVLIADDLIATGGSALAAARLVERAGGRVAGAAFIVDLPELGGSERLLEAGIDPISLIQYAGP